MSTLHPWEIQLPEAKRQAASKPKEEGLGAGTKTYTWRGETYFGATDVAAEADCSRQAVYAHMRKYGNLDRLGDKNLPHPRAKVVEVLGHSWVSERAFARDIGVSLSRVQRWRRSGAKGVAKMEAAVRQLHDAAEKPQSTVTGE